ncbi:MAG: hypothetical protein F4Y78_02015 [Candidatus Dadabacteria bacterium]|nr:hypothetical protein [Candidatus Dadabacteria bacterium]MYA47659.1 hypothetical protein [Candidatus Dadabacteria bacterium]MYK49759.1 hypothetical protein [Candidatus Dadabacteria bacterium]
MSITTDPKREIIKDFQEAIKEKKISTGQKDTINFRNDILNKKEREIFSVDLNLLRYRKENGRISSSVLGYEKEKGFLHPDQEDAQCKIKEFLLDKDPEKTEELKKMLKAEGQREPGIITCDGFLINGNRRKAALEEIHKENPSDEKFARMKVVILPGEGEEGGPPTLKEIEQIENRYQLQSDGKAEYFGFDAALSIKQKIGVGFSLKEQLRDNPIYKNMPDKDFKTVLKKEEQKLKALECIDRYLSMFSRDGQYQQISKGIGDPQGRWQAFIDYANTWNKLQKPRERAKHQIEDTDIEILEQVAFKAIRLRDIPSVGKKIHQIMREIPVLWQHGKDALIELNKNVEVDIPTKDQVDSEGNQLPLLEIDKKWEAQFQNQISYQIREAMHAAAQEKEQQQPLNLLEDAYKKLIHKDMKIETINASDLGKAIKFTNDIKQKAVELGSEIFKRKKAKSKNNQNSQ